MVSIHVGSGKQNIAMSHLKQKRSELRSGFLPPDIRMNRMQRPLSNTHNFNLKSVDKLERDAPDDEIGDKLS